MKRDNNQRRINEIARIVAKIKKPVAEYCKEKYKEYMVFGDCEFMPSPFDIADYYGIVYKFVKLEDQIPAYLSEGLGTIYISDKYTKENYEAKILCAHELGHYFLHEPEVAAMSNDSLNEYLPIEMLKEYEANIFLIYLMPQIMAGQPWSNCSPGILNRKVYEKVTQRGG